MKHWILAFFATRKNTPRDKMIEEGVPESIVDDVTFYSNFVTGTYIS